MKRKHDIQIAMSIMELKVEPIDAPVKELGCMSKITENCSLCVKIEAPVCDVEIKLEPLSDSATGDIFLPQIKREVNVDVHIDRSNETSPNTPEIPFYLSKPKRSKLGEMSYGLTDRKDETNLQLKHLPHFAEPSTKVINLVKTEVASKYGIRDEDLKISRHALNTSTGILPACVKVEALEVEKMDYMRTLPDYEVELCVPELKEECVKRTISSDGL